MLCPRSKAMAANDATISDQPRIEMAGCSKSFLGVTRRATGHCSEATPSFRAASESRVAINPVRRGANQGKFCEKGTRWCCHDCTKSMPKPIETSAFEAAMIQSSCAGCSVLQQSFIIPEVYHAAAERYYCEQDDACTDEEGGEPSAAIYVFVEEEFGGGGVANEGQGGRGGGGEREIDDREGVEHCEEVEGHAEGTGEEEGRREDGADGAKVAAEARAGTEAVEVTEAAHGGSDEALAGDGESDDSEDGAPFSNDVGREMGRHQRPAPESIRSRSGWLECFPEGCSVSEGPLATKPTAQTMRTMPAQR